MTVFDLHRSMIKVKKLKIAKMPKCFWPNFVAIASNLLQVKIRMFLDVILLRLPR